MRTAHDLLPLMRRERDSNPRNGQAVHRISSPAQSVTLASLLVARTAHKGTKKIEKDYLQTPLETSIKCNRVAGVMTKFHLAPGDEDFADIKSSPNPEYRRANGLSPLGSSLLSFHFEVWICLG